MRIAAAFISLLAIAVTPAPAQTIYREDFSASDAVSGLPHGWSIGPPAHRPYFRTARDDQSFGSAAPSLRVDLPLHTLNYWITSAPIPLPEEGRDYVVRLALRVDQPDAAFLVQIVFFDRDGSRIYEQRLHNLVGQRDDSLREYAASFLTPVGANGGTARIMFGLPYVKILREGRFWLDDILVASTRDPKILSFYLHPSSVAAGEEVELHASASTPEATITVYREGEEQTLIDGPRGVGSLSVEDVSAEVWRDGCRWPVSARIQTGSAWPSGVYTVKLDSGDRIVWSSFIVRGRAEDRKVLILFPTDTEEAYNDFGGRSFYSDPPSPVVSAARPRSLSSLGIYSGPVHLIRWLEREGIPYDAAEDADLHRNPALPFSYRAVVIPGHSEYWTRAMRSTIEQYIAAGGSVISLSGNTCWWQTRVEEDENGRRLVCYKYDAAHDPYWAHDSTLVTTHWDEPPLNDPPSRFLGLSWRDGGMVNWSTSSSCPCDFDWLSGHGGYQVFRTHHWVFAGTGLVEGDTLGRSEAIVGYEVDGAPIRWVGGRPEIVPSAPLADRFVVLGQAPCWSQYRPDSGGVALMGIAETGDSFVWNSGTTGWCWGLARDPEVQQITRNLIAHLPDEPPTHPAPIMLAVFPNPARDFVTIEWPASDAAITIDLSSVTGRRVTTIRPLTPTGSRSRVVWRFTDAGGRHLPAGVYWLRTENSGRASIVHLR